MKTVLFGFLLTTSVALMTVAILAFLGVLKDRKDKGKADDDIAMGMLASVICWMLGGFFIFLTYLAS